MTLAEIAQTDFLEPLLNEAMIWHAMEPDYEKNIFKLAELNRQKAVVDYLSTEKGRMEILTLVDEFEKIFETVRLHIAAELTRRKVQSEAGDELLKIKSADASRRHSR